MITATSPAPEDVETGAEAGSTGGDAGAAAGKLRG